MGDTIMQDQRKTVAAIITEYRRHSHADVIVGKILEGYNHDGKEGPRLRVASMYVDQFPTNDMSRDLARRHRVPIYHRIEDALTLGRGEIAVDGVLSIGEHGNYPDNDKGQKLYPRRRFFEHITAAFEKYKKSVPVFNDKHLAATWTDARWMYDRSRELFVPFLAGSSLPVTWRRPPLVLPRGCQLVEAVQIGYGPLESYGFHALESLQCMVERRRGFETGVRSVQCLQGDDMWKAMEIGRFSRTLLEAAMRLVPASAREDYRQLTARSKSAALFLIEYSDGFKATVAMMNGWAYEGDGGAFVFAGQLRDQNEPLACHFYLQQPDPFAHFAELLKAIDSTIHTGHAVYPVERTLLTTGILDAAMTSRHQQHRKLDTPHLAAIKYTPTDWPFAQGPVPPAIKR
jgi:hypothetical protein